MAASTTVAQQLVNIIRDGSEVTTQSQSLLAVAKGPDDS
jgi:phytoene/squalene synthetase